MPRRSDGECGGRASGFAPLAQLADYFAETRRPVYTFFLVLPFVLIYELGLAVLQLSVRDFDVRNGADAILRALFFPSRLSEAGTVGTVVWVFFSASILLGAFVFWQLRSAASWRLKPRYIADCYVEAFAWAVLLLVFWISLRAFGLPEDAESRFPASCAQRNGGADFGLGTRIVMSAGAGVYEELVFRLLITGGIALLLRGVVGVHKDWAAIAAVAVSSVLFSAVHYLGPYGDAAPVKAEEWLGFGFRVAAGVFFSLLFYFRSFGVAVAAHAFYDIIVSLLMAAFGHG